MPEPLFLSVEDVLYIHRREIERFGGEPVLRDRAALEAAVAAPRATHAGGYRVGAALAGSNAKPDVPKRLFLFGWLPGLHRRRGWHAALVALVPALVIWVPMCTHWPPVNRGNQKLAIAEIRAMASALEEIKLRHGDYPTITTIAELNELQSRHFHEKDPWGMEYSLSVTSDEFRIISYGNCGGAGSEVFCGQLYRGNDPLHRRYRLQQWCVS